MIFQKILDLLTLSSVFAYHFYNPSTGYILSLPSLNNIPRGYKLLPPPKSNRIGSNTGRANGICTDAGFTCTTPFAKSLTHQFECDEDFQCPTTYKCCDQKCFLHKICSKAISSTSPNEPTPPSSVRPGYCEKWPYNCPSPYPYSMTSAFKCDNDRQCPRSFKCCEQTCFLHKICSRAITIPTRQPNKLIQKDRVTNTQTPTFGYQYSQGRQKEKTEDDHHNVITEGTSTNEVFLYTAVDGNNRVKVEETGEEEREDNDVSSRIPSIQMGTVEGGEESIKEEEQEEVETNATTKITVNYISPNNLSSKPTASANVTSDSNAIIPEYSEYYYHYGYGNETDEDYDDYDEDDEEEEE